ncbi:MAG: thioredoxin [Planctomycetes bacterium]|nr:thioredoxin [Planctomycetota bacterium]MBT4029370.1 thioredoxin [Planctomycetota bacterium]MBT5101691.1 thioredoxin [Planctomycetota bacterium]MBT5119999.1 thioredoxin [Planctomycetota bacterium]MBT7012572.1 thioredoxin [Planctomycetota bacterium]
MSNALDVTDDSFQSEVVESQVPVLVDFWAPWCGPCRAMTPAVDQLAAEMGEKLKVVKMNTEENPSKGSELGVMAIPCFIVFKGGAEVGRHMGMMDGEKLKKFVEPHL